MLAVTPSLQVKFISKGYMVHNIGLPYLQIPKKREDTGWGRVSYFTSEFVCVKEDHNIM